MQSAVAQGDIAAHPALLKRLACAALAAEDDDVRAWVRLSLVCRTFRDALQGVPVTVDFSGGSSAAKRQWLESTAVPVRRLTFHREGYSGAVMLDESRRALHASEGTLTELFNVRVPVDRVRGTGHYLQPAGSLARFTILQALTLKNGGIRGELPSLPPTILTLVLDDDDAIEAGSARARFLFSAVSAVKPLRLGSLVDLRELTLRGSWFLRHVCGSPLLTANEPPELPPGLTVLRIEAAGDEKAVAHMSAEGLERLAHLSLLDVAAQRVPLGIPATASPAPGPRRLRLVYADLRMRVSLEAFLASKTRSQPPQAQVLDYLSRLPAGIEEFALSSCETGGRPQRPAVVDLPAGALTFHLNVDDGHENDWTHNVKSAEALAAAMQPYAAEHGFSARYDVDGRELMLQRLADT